MRRDMRRAALIAAALLLAPAALAQNTDGNSPASNFTIQPVEGGFLKLDTRTGAMSFCRVNGEPATAWACEMVPEDRAALEAEIARLQARLSVLEKDGGVPDIMSPPLQEPSGRTSPSHNAPRPKAQVPKDERGSMEQALDRGFEMAEHAFRRFMEMVDRLRGTDPQGEKL